MHHDRVNGIGIGEVMLVEGWKIIKHRFLAKGSGSERGSYWKGIPTI